MKTHSRWMLPLVVLTLMVGYAFASITFQGEVKCDKLTIRSGGSIDLALANGTVLIGNSSGRAIAVTPSGAVTTTAAGVFTLAAASSAATSLTAPLLIGGTAASSALSLESTSGTGTTDLIKFLTGSQSEAGRINTSGVWIFQRGEAGQPIANTLRGAKAIGTNIAGAALTIAGSESTGTGLGGSLIFQVANTQAAGASVNAVGTALTIIAPNTGTTAVVNGLTLTGAITTGTVTLAATGTDATVAFNITSKSTAALGLNTVSISSTGIITPTGGIAVVTGTGSTVFHSGDLCAPTTTTGTDVTPATTETYIAEVFVPHNATLTGISLLNGSAVVGNIQMALADNTGAVVANTASTAQSGTAAYQKVAFTGTYAAKGPAKYFILVQHNNTGNRFRAHALGNFGASKKTGETYGTFTTVTPPTTFTADLGPIADVY